MEIYTTPPLDHEHRTHRYADSPAAAKPGEYIEQVPACDGLTAWKGFVYRLWSPPTAPKK